MVGLFVREVLAWGGFGYGRVVRSGRCREVDLPCHSWKMLWGSFRGE